LASAAGWAAGNAGGGAGAIGSEGGEDFEDRGFQSRNGGRPSPASFSDRRPQHSWKSLGVALALSAKTSQLSPPITAEYIVSIPMTLLLLR